MIRIYAALIALCALLAACSSVPPAPTDRYYRLRPAPVAWSGRALPGPIAIDGLLADSLYAERAIAFSEEASPRRLRQYHYHLWLYAPARLVQDHLAASLGGDLNLTAGREAPWHLEGRIVRFDRVLGSANGRAAATLELKLSARGETVFAKTYGAEQAAANDSFSAFAAAMEQALARIYTEFLRDLDAAALTARQPS